jgi:hypothetical protein
MKNKNLVSLLAVALIAIFSITLTSCGDESKDPTPMKTDLQKVQEAIAGTTWTLMSANVTAGSSNYIYNGDCNFSQFPTVSGVKPLVQNLTDYSFTFGTNGKISWINNCFSQSENTTYNVEQNGNIFNVKINGSLNLNLRIINSVENINNSEIIVDRISPLTGGATTVKLKFSAV